MSVKLDILAIGVHPDDIELSCSGTLLSHIKQGKQVGLCDLTMGELGTRGSGELRLEEAEAARKIMGAEVRDNLKMADGFFQHSPQNIKKIISIIRKYKPEVVLANALNDRHPDHGRAAKLTADACYYSGLKKIETGQEEWRPKAVYHYIQDYNLKPDFVCDISLFLDQKIDCIMAFKSQFYNPDDNLKNTPISSKAFMDFIIAKGRGFGRHAGFEFAEGFNVNRTLGVQSLFDIR